METQNFLYDNSSKIPEGLYIELMNKLKIDFENKESEKKTKVIVINRKLPKWIACTKQKLIQDIIKHVVNFENREEILLKVTSNIWINGIKKMCKEYNIPTMCINPRWQRQEDLLQRLPDFLAVLATGQPIDIYDI